MAEEQRRHNDGEIAPGMKVEATKGDLGEQDVTPPQVTEVKKNQDGHVEALEISKGTLFQKKINVPVDRIQMVEGAAAGEESPGKVTVDVSEPELEALTATGPESLPPERPQKGLLDQVEQQVPTTEGIREMEL